MLGRGVQSRTNHGFVKGGPFFDGPSFLSWGFSNCCYYSLETDPMNRRFAPSLLKGALLVSVLLAAPLAALPAAASAQAVTDPAAAPAGTWTIDKRHTSVTMKVRHFGASKYTFRFAQGAVDASYDYNPAKPLDTKISVTIDAASVDTGLPDFNKEIGTDPKFFNAAQYPKITFVSTKVEPGKLTGDLTFRGVTKPVTLDVVYDGYAKTPFGSQIMGFSATGKIKRSDFGFTHLVPMVGDDVDLLIEVEFNPKK
jgi:polyisoprenoid-binding protein YceI